MTEEDTLPIYIIGDTPTAYLLAAKLTLAEENVYLINGQKSKDNVYNLSFLDNTSSQKSSLQIHTCSLMHQPARMVIFCLDPEKINAGLSFFSAAKAQNCPILSFCKTIDSLFMGKILQKTIIPAYFNGWLQQEENSLAFYGTPQGIQVSIDEDNFYFNLIQKIMAKTYLKITFNPDDTQNFWNDFIPNTANSLFALEYGPRLREIAKKQDLRLAYNDILDELISITPDNIDINKEQLINDTYLAPVNYVPFILQNVQNNQSKFLLFLQDTLQKQPIYNTQPFPFIKKIIKQTLKKLLSSVER